MIRVEVAKFKIECWNKGDLKLCFSYDTYTFKDLRELRQLVKIFKKNLETRWYPFILKISRSSMNITIIVSYHLHLNRFTLIKKQIKKTIINILLNL